MFEPGQRVVWLKSSALQRDAVHRVPAIVLGDDGWGRVRIEAYHANGGPVRRWVPAERLVRPQTYAPDTTRREPSTRTGQPGTVTYLNESRATWSQK